MAIFIAKITTVNAADLAQYPSG